MVLLTAATLITKNMNGFVYLKRDYFERFTDRVLHLLTN